MTATIDSPANAAPAMQRSRTHHLLVGYLLWIFGFTGAHRFYYGKPLTGTLWFCTGGLLFIGWIVDLFLIPGMDRRADRIYASGPASYTIAWALLTFLGLFGLHRMYLGKWFTGLVCLAVTGFATLTGLLFLGIPILLLWLIDLCTLNSQVNEYNLRAAR